MLIELLKPRRDNAPVMLPDGTSVQFNEDASGRLVADITDDQAEILLTHTKLYARAGRIEAPPVPAAATREDTTPSVAEPSRALEGLLKRGRRAVK